MDRIKKAIFYLVDQADSQPSVLDVARHVNMSESNFRREFSFHVGVSPKDFMHSVNLVSAKKLLDRGESVLNTSYKLGYSSPSRLHDLFMKIESVTPGEYKSAGKGMEIVCGRFKTPIGPALAGVNSRGITNLFFPGSVSKSTAIDLISERWANASVRYSDSHIRTVGEEVCARMKGELRGELNLLLKGTPFQIKVWKALLQIPEGGVVTYSKIAKNIKNPRALRAVGTAVGANPIGYLIPCHRVIQSTGALGNYYWGEDTKLALVGIEKSRNSSD